MAQAGLRQMSVTITVGLEGGNHVVQEVVSTSHYHLQGSFPTEAEFVAACTRNAHRTWQLAKDARERNLGPVKPKPKPDDLQWGEIKPPK